MALIPHHDPFQHDCDNNVELFRDGRYITFRTIKPIAMGQELTAHYGNGYCVSFLIDKNVYVPDHLL